MLNICSLPILTFLDPYTGSPMCMLMPSTLDQLTLPRVDTTTMKRMSSIGNLHTLRLSRNAHLHVFQRPNVASPRTARNARSMEARCSCCISPPQVPRLSMPALPCSTRHGRREMGQRSHRQSRQCLSFPPPSHTSTQL